LLLLSIAGMVSNAGAQVAPGADRWGEPEEGVQLRLALATTGPPTLPGELPALEVRIRNRGPTAVTVSPEALIYADVEIDDVWYKQTFAIMGISAPVVIAPGRRSDVVRTYQNVSMMFAPSTTAPARELELRPGPHRVRLRNLTDSFDVHTADGKVLALVSNRIAIDIPELSPTAEREALVGQASAGGVDGLPAARRMSGFSADVRFAIVQLFLPPPVWGQWEARAEWKLRCASLHGCTSRLHAGLAWNNETFRGPSEAEVRCSLVYRQGGGQECATQYRSNADDGARRDRGNRVGRLSRRRGGAGFFGRCSRRPRSFRR
jgi:hypothetical protein